MKHLFYFSILLLINLSCSYKNINVEAPSINEIKINEKFKINLPENHTDGYTWQQTNLQLNCLNSKGEVWHGNEKGIDFNYHALQVGVDTLFFVKRKYDDTLMTKKFIIKVNAN